MLGGLGGPKAGCRKLPRQLMCGLAVPPAGDVPERAALREESPCSWGRVGPRPMLVYISYALDGTYNDGDDLMKVRQVQDGKWYVVWPKDFAAPGRQPVAP